MGFECVAEKKTMVAKPKSFCGRFLGEDFLKKVVGILFVDLGRGWVFLGKRSNGVEVVGNVSGLACDDERAFRPRAQGRESATT